MNLNKAICLGSDPLNCSFREPCLVEGTCKLIFSSNPDIDYVNARVDKAIKRDKIEKNVSIVEEFLKEFLSSGVEISGDIVILDIEFGKLKTKIYPNSPIENQLVDKYKSWLEDNI